MGDSCAQDHVRQGRCRAQAARRPLRRRRPRTARALHPRAAVGREILRRVTLDPHGKQVWATLGVADVLSIDEARGRARKTIQRVKDGKPAFEAPPAKAASFEEIAEQWLKRHVRAKGLRSEGEVTRLLKAHVYSAWKGRAFLAIRRSDVAAL